MKINNLIGSSTSLSSALRIMDDINRKLLIITEGNTFIGVLSIGDIQRAIIKGIALDTPVDRVLRSVITVAKETDSLEDVRAQMMALRTECMPVINNDNDLVDVIFWEDIVEDKKQKKSQLNIPVVIMAGGKGTRLKPLTNVFPKPLIPVGDKTIMEEIMDGFSEYGCKDFFISVNYKADLIQFYLDSLQKNDFNVSYFQEDMPLGTAGSLFLLKEKIDSTFFVTNCDILVDQDYGEILSYHKENKNELTVVGALKHISIPYGTLETGENGLLKDITEKPEMTFLINSGMYILEPNLLDEIPENEFFHITSLIDNLRKSNRRVGVFPVSEKSWKDIGEWKEYMKFIDL